jgi:hypothetical protein
MTDLVVVVPSRGRPKAARELASAFAKTCTADTLLVFAVDEDDPTVEEYRDLHAGPPRRGPEVLVVPESTSMVHALNRAAEWVVSAVNAPFAKIGRGDDHRPTSDGWDAAYLEALRDLGTGIVYGDDLLQRQNLPTQCAMTSDIVRVLGYMAPPNLTHLYVDNFWLELGRRAECIRYLPEVVVEHRHPVAGKAAWDEGYKRVNNPDMYAKDEATFRDYYIGGLAVDVEKVRALRRVDA